jgi:hypothetical protein
MDLTATSACVPHRLSMVLLTGLLLLPAYSQTPSAKAVGTVKSVTANSLVLTSDSGTDTTVTFADSARIARAVPGQTDLRSAPSIAISEIQVGDRIAVRGQAGDANSLIASSAVVMKRSDIADKQQQERDEWRRGVGGIVKEVNPAGGTVTINNALLASGKPVIIHVSTGTEIRRYSPNSVKFEDTKPGSLDQIKAGDQLRARGTKNSDGTELTAQAIVSGSFRDIAGTVVSTDAASSSITVTDLATKKAVTVKIGPDSLVRKLPPFVAMGIAMRLKGGTPGGPTGAAPGQGSSGGNAGPGSGTGPNVSARAWPGAGGQGGAWRGESGTGAPGPGGGAGGFRTGGPPDFQQMLNRLPAVSISELNKGEAVMLVATAEDSTAGPTAITLLAGVEPILSAAPAGMNAAATVLSPWNLGQSAAIGGDAATGP